MSKNYEKKDIMITFDEHVKKVEKQMGMSVTDFHEKLEDLLTPEYLEKAEEYKQILDEWLSDGNPIFTHRVDNRKELELQDGEYFVPCFDPDKPARNELPIFWFYSNYDNLVSVYTDRITGEKKVIWLPPKTDGKDPRGVQKWNHLITGKIKSMKAYSLGALVMNAENTFGRAKELLELFGTYAYGLVDDQWNVNGHHEESYKNNRSRLYDNSNIGTLDVYAHDLLRRIRTIHSKIRLATSQEEKDALTFDLMKDIAEVTNAEAPGQGVIIWTGNRLDLDGNYKNDKGSYAYRYLADEVSDKEWYIGVHFFPDTDKTMKEWIVQNITNNQGRLADKIGQMLKEQNMPYGTFTVLPYTIYDVPVCNLMITHMRPAADVN